jgi:hypothetical protein
VSRLLNGNQLTGTLPLELGKLDELTRIQVDENQISGPIPPGFAGMTSLLHMCAPTNLMSRIICFEDSSFDTILSKVL